MTEQDTTHPSLGRYIRESLRRGTFWASLERWMRTRGLPYPMSWPAYAFDRYRRQRDALLPVSSLAGVSFGGRPGLVSIVLPAYNGADMLPEALDSILAQSYADWEVVAVDDGSTDATGAILDEYASRDARVRVIHQVNRKLPGALNTGFAAARGEFLTWTSCDNRLYPDCLARLLDSLRERLDWDMVYANIDLIGANGAPLTGSREFVTYQRPFGSAHILLPRDPSELNTYPNNMVGPCFLMRRRVVGLLGEHSLNRFTLEDYDYWMLVNALLKLRHARERAPLYQYRFHPGALTGRKDELKIAEKRAALMVFDDFRRDLFSAPMLWLIDAGDDVDEGLPEQMRALAARAGQVLLERAALSALNLPRLFAPLVYARLACAENAAPPPDDLPCWAFKALITDGPGVDTAGWDVVVTVGVEQPAPDNLDWARASARSIQDAYAAIDVMARASATRRVEAELFNPLAPERKLTVVVCTHHLAGSLAECLASLARQTFPAGDWEVIVVNNNPAFGELDRVVEQARPSFGDPAQLRLVHCPLAGLSHARNAGIAEARGEAICFIDDDAMAAPDWLAKVWQAFERHPETGVVGGRILLRLPEPAPRWLRPSWKRFWSHFDPPYPAFTAVSRWQDYPWGANWSARRLALLQMGGFRSGYGRKQQRLLGGEEIVAAALAQRLGWGIGVQPAAVVEHAPDPARFTLANVLRSASLSRRVWYRAQADGYIARETGLRASMERLRAAFRGMRAETLGRPLFTLWGELSLRAWLAGDWMRRMRKPAGTR